MVNIRTLIMDDEKLACDRLIYLLKNYKDIEILGYETSSQAGIERIAQLKPDVVFLDIEMDQNTSAFEIINEVKNRNIQTIFILVTAYIQYAQKAVKSQVFDYLLKPVDIDELSETMKRLRQIVNGIPGSFPLQFEILSAREKEIVKFIIEGKTSLEISEKLFISLNTVHTHRRNILKKLGLRSCIELFKMLAVS